jgi:hypothetical protein
MTMPSKTEIIETTRKGKEEYLLRIARRVQA